MVQLETTAQRHLENYLGQVRAYLRGCPSVDPGEVERDVREHVEREVQGLPEPVPFDLVDAVLKKLGSPDQWIPQEEIPWWRKTLIRLRSGPEDWRLAYLAFALFVPGLFCQPIGFVLILASFCVSRAAMSLASDDEELRPKRWLLYPPLILVYLLTAGVLLFAPIGGLIGLAGEFENSRNIQASPWGAHDDAAYRPIEIVLIAAGTGLWWLLLGCARKRWPGLFHAVFHPFSEKLKPAAVNWFIGIAAALFVLGSTAAALMLKYPAWYPVLKKWE